MLTSRPQRLIRDASVVGFTPAARRRCRDRRPYATGRQRLHDHLAIACALSRSVSNRPALPVLRPAAARKVRRDPAVQGAGIVTRDDHRALQHVFESRTLPGQS